MKQFKQLLLASLLIFSIHTSVFAQAPQKVNYQGIARNSAGNPIASQSISIKINILDGATSIYEEKHTTTTNGFGLFNLPLGAGTVINGTFGSIPWSTGNKFVKVEIDPTGGSTYTVLGTTELLSVPYALYAGQSAAGPAGPTGPTGATGAAGTQGVAGPAGPQGLQGIAGAIGATGATGATGPANTLNIGTITNGGSASATITGTAPNQTLNLVLPAGPTGVQGVAGANGTNGTNGNAGATGATGPANTLNIGTVTNGGSASATITGTAPNQTLNLVLPAGPTGAQGVAGANGTNGNAGATGPANTLNIGTVTNGGSASATITGTAPNQTLNLVLPAGLTGAQGVAGPTGPQGAMGSTGPQGATGIQGATGPQGLAGPNQTLSISGTTLSLSPSGNSVTLPAGGGGGLSGSGTTNFISKFTGTSALGNSQIQDNGTNIAIGAAPNANDKLFISQTANFGGLKIDKTNTTINSYTSRFTQSGTNSSIVSTNVNGTQSLGAFSSNNPALLSTVTSGNGAGLFGATIGTNTSAAIIGGSHSWTGGLFTTRDTLNSAASGLVGVTYSKRRYTGAIYGYSGSENGDSMHTGIYGTYNSLGFGIGVMGVGYGGNQLTTNIQDIGVYGSANDVGVQGQSSNGDGVVGSSIDGNGVSGISDGAFAAGVVGANINGVGVLSDGDLYVNGTQTATGTKSASISTSKGQQLVYCMESPGIWFEDFGNATLVNGSIKVELDPLFLETVKIDAAHPMVVTVTPMGDCKGLYVIPGTSGFEVRELQSGNANIQFSYRISAKRLNYEDQRFGKDKHFKTIAVKQMPAITPVDGTTKEKKSNRNNKELEKKISNTIK